MCIQESDQDQTKWNIYKLPAVFEPLIVAIDPVTSNEKKFGISRVQSASKEEVPGK